MIAASLAHPADRDGFYRQLDVLLQRGVAWDEVQWTCGSHVTLPPASPRHRTRGMPADFLDVCDTVLLHRDTDRFLRLHRMAQRLRADHRHWEDVLHEDHRHLQGCARQVRRDMHKMKAFVRFAQQRHVNGGMQYVAWFEPDHHIVQAIAPFFVRRFASMRWSILTPDGSLEWDGEVLRYGAAATRSDVPPPDAGEALWLTYYGNIFNPARVKERAMRREMPVRYWKNLPEAALIPTLIADAPRRSREMIAQQECGKRRAVAMENRAASPDALATLRRAMQTCDACECASRATQAVVGEGRAGARVMIVGEQPGDREDLEGRPFVGPAGQLLRAALSQCGVSPDDCYITNAVKHFRYEMRGKRRLHKTPLQRDVEACADWLRREYEAVSPQQVLLLGRTAITAATQCWGPPSPSDPWTTMGGAPIAVVAHPAALLRAGESIGSEGYLRWTAQIATAITSRAAQGATAASGVASVHVTA